MTLPTNSLEYPSTSVAVERRASTPGWRAYIMAKVRAWLADTWLAATMLIAYIASLGSFWYFFQTHQIIIYGDAYAHMLITRRLFDNATPGLAQLGGIWLPLPHLVMLPFIWNNYLWRTGLAGSIPSMICYLIATYYLFQAARRLTRGNSRASFLGTLLFILNPNVLYLQTTAMSELVLIATLTASSYYFLKWAQEDQLNDLIKAAFATFLATLARYDGWFLFVVFFILVLLIGLLKHQRRMQIEANLIVFGALGGLGIPLWLAWCDLIFGDPLYFQRSAFSSQSMQRALINAHVLFTYHDLWQSIRYYSIDCIANVGLILCMLTVIAVIVFMFKRRITVETLASLAFLAPYAFYIISLYGGQAALYTPGAVPAQFDQQIYNARYGVEMVAPAALFIAALASSLNRGHLYTLGHIALALIIPLQSLMIVSNGIVSLEDGQFGVSCAHSHTIILYLAQHYNGGRILEDLYDTKMDALNPEASISFKDMVYEGSGQFWKQALGNPASSVDWIIVNQANPFDQVAQHLTVAFNTQYTRDIEEPDGLSLYHRNGLDLPNRPIPQYLLTEHFLCGATGSTQTTSPPTWFGWLWQRGNP